MALVRQPNSCQITFSDIESVDLFDENIIVSGKTLPIRKVAQKGRDGTIRWSSPSVLLRVHWLPFFIEDQDIVRSFYPYGTVLSISHDLSTTDGLPNGVQKVRLETTNPEHLPHILPLTFMAHKYW